MNFFEHQEQAQKNTRWVIFLFIIAIIILSLLTEMMVLFLLFLLDVIEYTSFEDISLATHFFALIPVISVITFASLYRMSELNSGGQAVAEELGGRLVSPSTMDYKEQRLINVVEEMAIASGAPVPRVYLLDSIAINAFAAGYTLHDAVIGVSKGSIELLNREQLQGVIAHEFSHILYGDMRFNLRLTGIIYGILFLGLAGEKITRVASESRNGGAFVVFGIGLVIIGYSGVFFGNLIKAAVCRQREFLADASAVQFTRNPEGIAGALKIIGGWSRGSILGARNAAEYSHCYIAAGIRSFFDTHPSLPKRIKRIDPSWDEEFPKVTLNSMSQGNSKKSKPKSNDLGNVTFIATTVLLDTLANNEILSPEHINYAESLIQNIPEKLIQGSGDPLGAYALALGIMLHIDKTKRTEQIKDIYHNFNAVVKTQLFPLLNDLNDLNIKSRLPLLEIALPSLKNLSESQKKDLNNDLSRLIASDSKVDLWEWSLYKIITLSLNKPELPGSKYNSFLKVEDACRVVLAALVYSVDMDQVSPETVFYGSASELGINNELPERKVISITALNQSVKVLRKLKPALKFRFLKSLCLAAEHDGVINVEEFELIRAISECLDCPIPPSLFVNLEKMP